ncbi:MAG: InlB B-repeat-containing protein [Bacilli bacterium]|nr:InlB B-repeat-containing protein [Bacilli bacterium]
MKKLGLLVMPLMAVSLLASCGGSNPTPVGDVTHKFTFVGKFCTINGENNYSHDIYEKDKNVQYTIVPSAGYKLPSKVEGVDFNPTNGVITISEIKADININVTAIPAPTPGATHVVSFDARGGTVTSDNPLPPIESGSRIATPPTLADRAGYDEQEVTWNTKIDGSGDTFEFDATTGTQVVADMILYAQWGNISQFTVNFYNDDGNPYNSLQNIKVNYGDKVTYKDCPTDSTYDNHYNFDGWYTKKPSEAGAELFPFDTPLTGDSTTISIYAKHSKKNYHVTFDANGGEITSGGDPLDITYNESIPIDKRPTASRDGYSDTTTWCTDKAGANVFTFGSTPITDNATLYAKWGSPTPSTTHTVTLDANGGSYITGSTYSFGVKEGDNLSKSIKAIVPPYLNEKAFAYYTYDDGTAIDYDDIVTSDVELKANYFDFTAPLTDLDSPKNISWKEIKAVATTNYNPSSCFKIGATKKVYLKEQTSPHTVRIIGFNHDDLADGSGKGGITFEFADVITKSNGDVLTTTWNYKQTTLSKNYDYRVSTLNDFLNDTEDDGSVINMLPSDPVNIDLKEVIKPVNKKVGVNESETKGDEYYIATSFDGSDDYPYPYLFPLAHDEINTHQDGVVNNEGSKYQYYIEHPNDEDRIKRKVGIESGDGEDYWLRSPRTSETFIAWIVHNIGNLTSRNVYSVANAVAPAFCI